MRRRSRSCGTSLKAWLLLLVPARLLAFAGWKLGGYRLALLFGGSVVLLGGRALLVRRPDRDGHGRRARAACPARRRRCTATRRAPRGPRRRRRSRGSTCSPTATRAPSRPAVARRAAPLSRSRSGCSASRRRRSSRASSRTSSRICATATCSCRRLRSSIAAAIVESSRIGGLLAAVAPVVLGPLAASFVHLLLSPKREFEADRFAAELCDSRTGSPTRCSGSSRRWSSSRSRRARRPSRSTRRTRSRRRASRRCS